VSADRPFLVTVLIAEQDQVIAEGNFQGEQVRLVARTAQADVLAALKCLRKSSHELKVQRAILYEPTSKASPSQ